MKKLIGVLLCLGLTVGSIATASAKPKPVKTTLYMHGVYQFGEIDGADWIANGTPPMQMTTAKPDGSAPKSMHYNNPALNKSCTGLPTGFPTWEAMGVAGTVIGDAKLTMNFASPPTKITARLWIDAPMFSCNEAYIQPTSEVIVDVLAGQNEVEIIFPKLKKEATFNMIVEILGAGASGQGRVLYDSTDMASALTFNCIPTHGSSCI